MTPKQRYDERKRLRLEAKAAAEDRVKDRDAEEKRAEAFMISLEDSLRRIADAAELWADMQRDKTND